ncbi:MAG: GLPGLI family protein [Chitinophagaceae bacterium]
MSRSLYFISFLLCSITAVAQQHYTIRYETRSMITSKTEFDYPSLTMVIRDSVSYTYYLDIRGVKKKLPLGSTYMPKSSFSKPAACLRIFPTGEYDKPKTYRLVVDSCRKGNWTITQETRIIAGYNCTKATGWQNGLEYTAWFTPDLPNGFAPYFIHDLPGTVLEYWHEKGMSYTTAVEIKKQAVGIVEPNYCKKISLEEYRRSFHKQ